MIEPWRRVGDAAMFHDVANAAGLSGFTVRGDVDTLTLDGPDDWWRIVMGSGLRRTVEALGDETAIKVRVRCGAAMQEQHVRTVELSSQHLLVTRG